MFIMDSDTEHRRRPEYPPGFGPPRYQQGSITTALQLGPLASLAGSWKGTGFNAIWRPDNRAAEPTKSPNSVIRRFLELNKTSETLDFHVIPGAVPNRGLEPQPDLMLYGLHYLQRVTDANPSDFDTSGQALHIEPGFFMNVPASGVNLDEPPPYPPTVVNNGPTIVRLASIPHGVTVVMQGSNPGTTPTLGPPTIHSIYPIPGLPAFTPASPALGLGIQPTELTPPAGTGAEHIVPEVNIANDVAGSQSNAPWSPGTGYPSEYQGYINDPNSLLRDAIAGQDILGFIQIDLSTVGVNNSIGNIPFLGLSDPNLAMSPAAAGKVQQNAFVHSASATFWIEWVRWRRHRQHHGRHEPRGEGAEYEAIRAIEPFWPEPTYLQLQYSQMVILVFNGVLWPHVTVATLTLSAG
jgi:hypothetical protein